MEEGSLSKSLWIQPDFLTGLLKKGRACVLSLFLAGFISSTSKVAFAQLDSAQESLFQQAITVQTQNSYSRLMVSLEPGFKPEITADAQGFRIFVPQATLIDLGIPFGLEEPLSGYVTQIKDSRISKLKIEEADRGLIIQGKYEFPKGASAFANPKMEFFEFRQAEKGKWVVDFWYRKGPTVAEAAAIEKAKKNQKERAEQIALEKREAERKAAREKRIQEAKNALLFCEQPFDKDNTVFIKYRPEHPNVSFSAYFPELVPDHRFEYLAPKGKGEEADMVRLALKLSKENNHALVVKTVDFLEKEYPKSKYLPEMQFLKASSFYRLELIDQGKKILSDLKKSARGSEVALQAAAFLSVQSFAKEEWLIAIDGFMNIKREFPKHSLTWLFRMGLADAFFAIRQGEQAEVEYAWVAENAPKAQARAEAAFKVGDIYFSRNQFAVAIQRYSQAIQKFQKEVEQYPQVLLNLAESTFQLGEYERAEGYFLKYQEIARAQPSAWRAALRLAEIRALHHKMEGAVEKSFVETVNSYPMTLGAVIARLRLLPCGNHGGFDLAGMERFVNSEELKNVEQSSALMVSTFRELVGLSEVRAYLSFGQDEKAIEKGLVHLRNNPTVEVRKLIEKAMIGGIKRLMAKELDSNNIYGAMALYERLGDYLPMPSHDPHADELRLKLGKFAAEKNLKSFALKLIEPYQKASEVEQRELAVAIQRSFSLEGIQDYEERTASQVKAIWNAPDFDINNPEKTTPLLSKLGNIRDSSPYSFTRDLIKALYFAESKSWDQAQVSLEKLVSTHQYAMSAPLQKVQILTLRAEVAKSLENENLELTYIEEARKQRQKYEASKSKGEELKIRRLKLAPSLGFLFAAEGELLEKLGKNKDAVALYRNAIENGVGGNRILYAHARAALKEGGRNSKLTASRSLEKIQQSQEDDVWKNLAQKALEEIAKEGKDNGKREP